jgi:serine-type D-Ala-D-Ala carboxypeptidase/endopeptidase (penicillin-binding protein 4)
MIKIFAHQGSFHFLFVTFLFATCGVFLQSCDAVRSVATTSPSKFAKKGVSIKNLLENSPALNDHFMGFMLYDPVKKKVLHEQNAHKYFVPASNTKILTLLTALKTLGDSLPAFQYEEKGDSLFLFPSGNPAFLHPDFQQNERVLSFLRKYQGKIYLSTTQFMDSHYGTGWAWDDYMGSYAPEKSALPMYGNVVSFQRDTKKTTIQPPYFQALTKKNEFIQEAVTRALDANTFEYNANNLPPNGKRVQVPFKTSAALSAQLLSDTLKRTVYLLKTPKFPSARAKTLNYTPIDTVFRKMMYESDNLIAEQLLLMSAAAMTDTAMTYKAIRMSEKKYLSVLPDAPIWEDGSGLSRYNLFTPATVVKALDIILQSEPQARVFNIFATGGKHGTVKLWYGGNPSYVFAKTGTLSNIHTLSGYIRTKKGGKQGGKILIFSFMHNNFTDSLRATKIEMQQILEFIRDNY